MDRKKLVQGLRKGFLAVGKVSYKIGKAGVKVAGDPRTQRALQGFGEGSLYVLTGNSPFMDKPSGKRAVKKDKPRYIWDE